MRRNSFNFVERKIHLLYVENVCPTFSLAQRSVPKMFEKIACATHPKFKFGYGLLIEFIRILRSIRFSLSMGKAQWTCFSSAWTNTFHIFFDTSEDGIRTVDCIIGSLGTLGPFKFGQFGQFSVDSTEKVSQHRASLFPKTPDMPFFFCCKEQLFLKIFYLYYPVGGSKVVGHVA